MNDAPERIYTNKNGTAIITPPAIPLHETDIEWVRAERVARLVRAVKAMPDDWCCDDDCDPCEELRAALRDMGGRG